MKVVGKRYHPTEEIIRRSFINAAESCVRFANFGATKRQLSSKQGDFFQKIAESQAHDDFVVFAIAARRLADVGGFTKQARKQKIQAVAPLQCSPSKWILAATEVKIDLYELLDRLIHSSRFEIVSDDFQLKELVGKLPKDDFAIYQESVFKSEFKPAILVVTDRKAVCVCLVEEIALKSVAFLDHVSNDLSERGIYLGNHNYD